MAVQFVRQSVLIIGNWKVIPSKWAKMYNPPPPQKKKRRRSIIAFLLHYSFLLHLRLFSLIRGGPRYIHHNPLYGSHPYQTHSRIITPPPPPKGRTQVGGRESGLWGLKKRRTRGKTRIYKFRRQSLNLSKAAFSFKKHTQFLFYGKYLLHTISMKYRNHKEL